ncbi:MAG: response regulator [Chloroflexi bacterium]|nr:response regulator [Chloroflexota bacterium]
MDQHTILFVDDEEQIRRLLSSFLTRRGYAVTTAVDGQEALNLLESERPDLVITDVNMPNVDGVELTRRLRAHPQFGSLPIIMLSAKVQTDEILAGYAEGADEYVPKPIEMRILAAKVESLLRRATQPPAPSAALAPEPEPPRKHVIAFVHGKGGVGATTLAVNAGVALAAHGGRRVTLLDLDLAYGDAATMLGLPVEHTLADLAEERGSAVSLEALHALAVSHESGLDVLVGSDRPERAGEVGGTLVRLAIEDALDRSDVVLVDTAAWWSKATRAALAAATTVCVVTTPRLVALQATASCLASLDRLGIDRDRVRLVLNSTTSRGLKPEAAARKLDRPVDVVVPYLSPFADAARALKPLDRGQTDQVGAIVARDLAARVTSFPAVA